MSKLVCDICGGKLTLVSGGTAVCDNCGINYSKEYLKEKVKESIACVKQTVKINIEENLRRTKVYLSESNFRDAKKYVSEILEVEDSNWLAKLYKVMCEEKFYINPDETSLERKLNYYNYKNKNIKFPIVQDKILDIVKEINVLNIDADEKIKIMNALAACLCRVGTAKSYYYSKLYYDKVLYSDSEPSVELETNHLIEQYRSIGNIESAMALLDGMEDSLSNDNVFYMKEAICHIIEDITYYYAFGGDEKLIEKYKGYREFLFSIDKDADRNEVLNTAYVYEVNRHESYSSMQEKAKMFWKKYDQELLKNR